jgi:hypothetical protein
MPRSPAEGQHQERPWQERRHGDWSKRELEAHWSPPRGAGQVGDRDRNGHDSAASIRTEDRQDSGATDPLVIVIEEGAKASCWNWWR